mgnify:CR=1 FL=1
MLLFIYFLILSLAGCTLTKQAITAAIIVVNVKTTIGTGYLSVEMTGAALRIILAKNAPKPKAVADFSTSNMRALHAT